MKLFLDDVRQPKDCLTYMGKFLGDLVQVYAEDNWYIVRTAIEFINFVNEHKGEITLVSFDHDLADEHYATPEESIQEMIFGHIDYARFKEFTGYHAANFLYHFYHLTKTPLPKILIHTMNPVGRDNIEAIFKPKAT